MKKNTRGWKIYRCCLAFVMLIGIGVICAVMYMDLYRKTPDRITLKAGVEQKIDMRAPLSGWITPRTGATAGNRAGTEASVSAAESVEVNFNSAVTLLANECTSYTADLRLFGILPFKTIEIDVIDDVRLIPAGVSIGIYIETTGVFVLEAGSFTAMDGIKCAPAENILQTGDYILKVNGQELEDKEELIRSVENSAGEAMILTIERGGEQFEVRVIPEQNEAGEYKLGVWVRDSAQGIGTMTYIDVDGSYGALGHGITDSDTGDLMKLEEGYLYETDIIAIKKGEEGTPGELTGVIRYLDRYVIGSIDTNSPIGIYGTASYELMNEVDSRALPVATRNEIETGPATILSSVNGRVQEYDIEITAINQSDHKNRELGIRVTDQELIELTGGIVQGMSGSPILQNGRIVGAVTHVLVKDATKGYGICIENMLERD